jgi:hypothetical protein
MDNLKVYLQYPWKSADSTYYKNILDYPPKGIVFLNNHGRTTLKREVIGSSKKFESTRKLKNFLRKILNIVSLPNLVYTPRKSPQIIHCIFSIFIFLLHRHI